ncbi:MAG TPA: RNA polymerase factor sigma-54 [Solimonas sp.]|nr:RNA polymerase factor sigma-54 [Solimonas sp.]
MKTNMHLRTSQNMAMTPQLLQSIRLLQLSSLELEQELREALETNVMLEQDEGEGAEEPAPAPQEAPSDEVHGEVTGIDSAAHEKVEADFDWSSAESWSGGEPPEDDDRPWQERHPSAPQTDARIAALEQLQLTIESRREALIAEAIIEAIDDNGYLEQPLDEIVARLGPNFATSLEEVEQVLEKVQAVEPTGFAARNLAECLALQLRALPPRTPGRDLAEFIAATALELVAAGNTRELEQALDVSRAEIGQAVALIRTLNPKPAAALSAPAEAVLPDLIVTGTPGAWKVELNAERLPRVRVNSLYERLLTQSGTHRGLRDQLQEARWLVRGLEIRHQTLLRTARVIFQRQQAFLENGEEGMAPLTLREVAESIAMHESTVCRVTSNKWVQTPWGVYELKAFFPSHITGLAGETSGTAVKAMIRRIIDGEGRGKALSDGDIAALLARKGIRVARRTVAKYREAMKIASAKERAAPAVRHAAALAG